MPRSRHWAKRCRPCPKINKRSSFHPFLLFVFVTSSGPLEPRGMTKTHKDMILQIDPTPAFDWSQDNPVTPRADGPECREFIEPVTCTGRQIGWVVGGFHDGPNVVITAEGRMAARLFRRLLRLPTINRLHGRLFLIEADDRQLSRGLPRTVRNGRSIDEMLHLTRLDYDVAPAAQRINIEKSGYWTVLRLLKRLGMIQGRGVTSYRKPATGTGIEPANPLAPWKPASIAAE